MPIFKFAPLGRQYQRLFITLVCLYLLSPFGATFNGVVIPDFHAVTFGLMLLTLCAWIVMRLRFQWRWHRTVLDPVIPLWFLAIAASMLANPDAARRSLIALWFVAVYIAAWYVLQDWIANRPSDQELLVDGLLGAGLMVMAFSAVQILFTGNLLQPVSVMGNSNALGSFLVLLVPFALRKAWRARAGIRNTVWYLYSAAAIVNLALTLSRGAWIGLFVACATLCLLLLAHLGILSPALFLAWWSKRSERGRRQARVSLLAVSISLVCATAMIVHSFTLQERSASLRTEIWRSALLQFSDAPITGSGLFAFGRHSRPYLSIPPAQNYSHAHNLPLNVAAEMGIIGLFALGATVMLTVQRLHRLWHLKTGAERLGWLFFVAALVGMVVHHLFDVTAMMPAVALLGMVSLLLALDPSQNRNLGSTRAGLLLAIGITILWVILLAIGYEDSQSNKRYIKALRLTVASKETGKPGQAALAYRQALETLDELSARDPTMPVYHLQSALLWGLLAAGGHADAITKGIEAFERFLYLEPFHAISWANLATLQWQAGDRSAAIRYMERARALAPRLPLFAIKLHQYRNDDQFAQLRLPHSRYNQDFTRYQFLRESLPVTFLPQISWSFQLP